MQKFIRIASAAAVSGFLILGSAAAFSAEKNWTPPSYKILGQKLMDEQMAKNPELLSATMHGEAPGKSKVYTMFAGSFPDRIGNADDPDDIEVIEKGVTIIDPRWNRTKDTVKKIVMMMPMRDVKGDHIGLVVYAFKDPKGNRSTSEVEKLYMAKGAKLRDDLAKKTPSYAALFTEVKK